MCSICPKSVNFNCPSCNSCKAFFRRTAPANKVTPCPFTGSCLINKVTRKFCGFCRLKKCFDVGMKKEWIYTEEERAFLKERIELNKQKRRQQQQTSSEEDERGQTSTLANVDLLGDNFQSITLSNMAQTTENQIPSSFNSPEADSTTTCSSNSSVDLYIQSLVNSPSTDCNERPTSPILQLDSSLENVCDQILQQQDVISQIDLTQIDFAVGGSYRKQSFAKFVSNKQEETDTSLLLLDFEPPVFQTLSIFNPSPFLGLPSNHNLSTLEENLLQELTTACRVLQNPYKRIQYFESLSPHSGTRIIEYTFYRINRCCKQLTAFATLPRPEQCRLLQGSLLKIFCLRMVLYFNERRSAWNLIDDYHQSGMLVRFEYLIPSCPSEENIRRHRRLSAMFDDEWKDDPVIFDLLTAVFLFMPSVGSSFSEDFDFKIRSEHNRYLLLLQKYLQIKYPTANEASETFNRLLEAVNELLQLNPDVVDFFLRYSTRYGAYVNQEFYRQLISCSTEGGVQAVKLPLDYNYGDFSISEHIEMEGDAGADGNGSGGNLDSIFDTCWM